MGNLLIEVLGKSGLSMEGVIKDPLGTDNVGTGISMIILAADKSGKNTVVRHSTRPARRTRAACSTWGVRWWALVCAGVQRVRVCAGVCARVWVCPCPCRINRQRRSWGRGACGAKATTPTLSNNPIPPCPPV